ncbi:Galactokinase [Auxenochlorella protothecoides]|uniref:Galactokinase n=1 Tax=Auxenochlorella protothecoides TaxID=3075 RepID=A0A087SSA5_AUXPR|nr:Galactokinase [Auxenochlorella protothecoides]KFM28609.1 Galactokinase [Auxenochlorella protothecoides]RMZ55767.1 hypothetical protein APUTEX25_005808 [Auxenochlorella protothecoides]|eukprot:RMZ55767.1 hypothetical protein APUTEX25_005808 [Auxenochlorella protothecoides]
MEADACNVPQAIAIFVPGRLCLFGEHSDWAGSMRASNPDIVPGRTIVVTTEQGLYARARRRDDALLHLTSTTNDGRRLSQTFDLQDPDGLIETARAGGFWSYAAGMAYKLALEYRIAGLEIDNHATTLPLKRGLSSSAALCVLLARAANRVLDLGLTTRDEMRVAYEGERLTPSRCGRMDQAVALGRAPALMTFDGDAMQVESVALREPLHLVLADLRAGKDTVQILSCLQQAYPVPSTSAHHALVRCLGPLNESLTVSAAASMARGDVAGLGRLMTAAQAEFDTAAGPLCPSQLGEAGSPVLHRVLRLPAIQPHLLGGKGVGSQGDGTAQLLCRDADAQRAVVAVLTQELGLECIAFTVPATAAGEAGEGRRESSHRETGGGGERGAPGVLASGGGRAAAAREP